MSQTEALLQAVREIEPILRQYAAEAEQERKLSAPVAKAFKDAGLYRMWRPKTLGGFELDPVSGLRVIEAVSRIDSAAGWNLQIADLFAPWFGDKAAAKIFHADAIPVGAFNPPRLAIPVEGGYRISGRTPFVSGAHHASVYLGFAKVHDGGDEPPDIRLIAVPAPEAIIIGLCLHPTRLHAQHSQSLDQKLRIFPVDFAAEGNAFLCEARMAENGWFKDHAERETLVRFLYLVEHNAALA